MQPTMPNRLATEASPYLLQHANNPVAWWPWCEEALAEARARDVPILLSIGYSACHWCHVMERESFEDAAIAEVMNALFVNVKVDREERPDLDQIYQLTVQLMGRSGGWPLTVFLTPAQKPFFAGTYFPPDDRHGMPGFPKVLRALAEAYRDRRDEVLGQAEELTKAIAQIGRGTSGTSGTSGAADAAPGSFVLGRDLLQRAAGPLLKRCDDVYGGFGDAPKFPNTMPLEVLLRRGVLEDVAAAREAARLQLERMRRGGIWDHLGGGFHRYSTDREWLVPHFEKMLYDNALLLRAYVDGSRALGEPAFADVARDVAQYVAREMTDPDGGFYASQDADSEPEPGEEKQEGAFFVWSPADVRAALGDGPDAEQALKHFGITLAGNFEEHGRPTFKTVLSSVRDGDITPIKEKLFAAREARPKPFRDEKVLTSWNALMIGALAEAGAALDEPALTAAAERAFAFVWATMLDGGRVARLCKKVDGEWLVKKPGFLDDHAYLANAALDLYEATGAPGYVAHARAIADALLDAFYVEGEGFYFTPKDGEALITRAQDPYDNAVPSGSSIACRALLRLGALVGDRYAAIAERELVRLAPEAAKNPFAYGQSICELDRLVRGSVDVVLVGPRADARTKSLARATFTQWLPNRTVAWLDPTDAATLEACSALAEGKPAQDAPAAYVCRGRTCSLPVTTPAELLPLLTPS
ncbi:MAG: thioredoxin domain-containing protein [Labilithrix sp.]|nr:thioredoxin domain-containing protein [Labilithrix sp.]MCW5810267.1 thioredoxin domain-containing protein [Labilithrix sp.]